jgi:hypothetical protein
MARAEGIDAAATRAKAALKDAKGTKLVPRSLQLSSTGYRVNILE